MKKHFIILLGLIAAQTLAARDSDTIRYPAPACIRQTEAWLASRNATGLLLAPVQKISMAEVFVNKGDGGFVNYYQSDNSCEWGAETESYYRLDERVTLYGKVRYANFTGQNMTGSAFIDPAYNAFDFSETADSTRGKKNMETFLLVGGVAARLGRGFSLGGKVDYRTANYAKFRDLRHTNKLLDLTASAGLSYRIPSTGDSWALTIGGCYLYRRSVEGLTFSKYGLTDKQYYTLINFGSFYGANELWNASGSKSYTIDSKPMFNEFNGGAIQAGLHLSDRWSVFSEASYLKRDGYYGQKSSYTYVFTNHNGTETAVSATVAYDHSDYRHSLSLKAGKEHLENYELISQEEHTQGNRTTIIYTGKNQVSDRNIIKMNAEYIGSFGLKNFCPSLQFKAGVEYFSRNQRTSVYPYYRLQNIRNYTVYASANRTVSHGKNQYGIALGARYGAGGGTPKDDKTYAQPSSEQKPPKSLDNFLYREYEYLTASRCAANVDLEYARAVSDNLCAYVHLSYDLTYATKTEHLLQKSFGFTSLSVGCRF